MNRKTPSIVGAAVGLALFLAYLNTRTNIPGKFMFGVISLIALEARDV